MAPSPTLRFTIAVSNQVLKPAEWPDIASVAARMRERDRAEICALQYTDNPVEAVSLLQHRAYIGVTLWTGDEPQAVIGARPLWPGVASAFMFATDRWPEVARIGTKYVRRVLIPSLAAAGVHRLEAKSLADHDTAHRWMERFGAERECTLYGYGKGGEDFVVFTLSLS